MDDLHADLDAVGLAAAIRRGELSAADAIESALGRIEERNGVLNAVVAVRSEAARRDIEAGLPDGPLTGVPIVVKDLGATVAGMPSTRGSRLFADVVAESDSELIRRYRAAGAVVVGMSNTPEFGRNGSTESILLGPAHNPHGLGYSTGGSSGGTAAAVAAGIVPVGHANDGGGSIRIPAAECGLIGLKPSRGRVSALPALTALAYPLGINHAITRTVRDTALLLDVGQGAVAGDPYVIALPARPYLDEVGAGPGRCRIAFSTVLPNGDPVFADGAAAVARTAALLEALGHELVEATPTYPIEDAAIASGVFMSVPLTIEVDARLEQLGRGLRDDDLEPLTRMLYEGGKQVPGTRVVEAHHALERASRTLGAFFTDYDVLVTPTLGRTVPPLGLLNTSDLDAMRQHASAVAVLTSPYNVSGQPAISLPLGTDTNGLPVGVQLAAAYGREDLLIRIAAQLEATEAWSSAPVWPPKG